MASESIETKRFLRERLRERVRSLSRQERVLQSRGICDRLLSLPELERVSCVLGFWPMVSEPDIRPVLDSLVRRGGRVLLPVVRDGVVPRLGFSAYVPGGSLNPNRYGILEPDGPPEDPGEAQLALVPALGVGPGGERLGHGGGYYDELAATLSIPLICPIFEEQLLAHVPLEPHDRMVSTVVLPTRVIRTALQA